MSEADAAAVERIIANTINETARGDPDALAARIVAALGEAGYRIVPASGIEDTALGSQPDMYGMEQLYLSPNGDTWFLARNPTTGLAVVRHQANASSGGQVTDIEIANFLSGPPHPEQEALLRFIGASIVDTKGAEVEDKPPSLDTGREWSDADLNELGNMLVRGLSIEEIARLLRRDHREVRDKVAEVGRACRVSPPLNLSRPGSKIFTEQMSGAVTDRRALHDALEFARSGDTLIVWKLDRLARSMKQLIETVEHLRVRGIGFRSLTEALDTTTAQGRLVFHMFGALAEFERSLIRERTQAGLAAARRAGRTGGRPPKLTDDDIEAAKAMLANPDIGVTQIAHRLGVSPATLYRYIPAARTANTPAV
jgi:DNA invertase Pin-like site-specific DNA recombinase